MSAKFNINARSIHSVGDYCTVRVNSDREELGILLSQALEKMQPSSPMHQALLSLQSDINNTGTPSTTTQSLITRGLGALGPADKAVGIVQKVVGTLYKLGWLP